MDCFQTRYFELERKLMVLIGQWPYQKYSDRMKRWVVYNCVMVTAVIVQVARATKAEFSFDLAIEFVCETLVGSIAFLRYYTYAVYHDKIKKLMDKINIDWVSVKAGGEAEVFFHAVEEARVYVMNYAVITYAVLGMWVLAMVSSPLLYYTPFFNETCPILRMYSDAYIVDVQKYCLPILIHTCFVIVVVISGAFITDTMYIRILYHAVTMFKITCYRLEHSFDNCLEEVKCASGRTNVGENIARAVESHRTAIRFVDDIVSTFEWPNLISLGTTLLSIAVALYWAAMSKGQGGFKVVVAVLVGCALMIHIFMMDIPAQKMIDHSGAVTFKAYSSQWYMGHSKEQVMLLLTMQRGLKPSAMVIGRMYPATLENFATEVQASLSYFTVLLSLK